MFIVLTTECDKYEDCTHCFYNVEPEKRVTGKLSTESLASFLKKMRLLNVPNIYFTGGEPLLRDDLETLVTYSRSMGLNTFILSNGMRLDPDRAARLDTAGLDVFVNSLSALNHKEIRSIHNVRKFTRSNISFIYVIRADNIENIPDVFEMAQALRAGLIFQPAYIPEDHELYDELSLANIGPFEWSRLYSLLRPWATAFGFEDYLSLMHDFYNKKTLRPRKCGMARDAFALDADGTVYPCFHRRDIPCGNIVKDDIGMIFSNLENAESRVADAACFGEHCISMHTGFRTAD